jgi:N-acetylmuramic acid 6-phosphate etherase
MASSEGPQELDLLVTEARGSADDYDRRSTQELVELMNAGDLAVPAVVGAAAGAIAAAIDAIVERLQRGGRLVYAGAGSSGRIAALDADECEATFSTQPGQVVALVAGGALASPLEQERAEDDAEAGRRAVSALDVSDADAVVGISASGRTPFVLGALEAARAAGASTACIVSAPGSQLAGLAEHEIEVVVGPELVAGSTRLKAGTAQKLVLNTISTVSMIRLGKTFGDLMVDVRASNEKLEARARRIVSVATGASAEEAERALAAADGSAKVAIVSLLGGVDAETARSRLDESKDDIRSALRR